MRLALRVIAALVLVASAAILAISIPKGVDVDLYSLAGDDGGLVPLLARRTSSVIRVLPVAEDSEEYARTAYDFESSPSAFALADLLSTHGKGLLGEKHRALLLAGETNRIARSALRRDYTGVGLFPSETDPYYFLNDFVMELKDLRPKEEVLVGLYDAKEPERREGLVELLEMGRRGEVYLSGAPFHTHLATENSKREINLLGGISSAAVFLIGFMLFRNFRFLLPMGIVLAAGFAVAGAAVFLLPGRPHVLTFLFGTSLIGLGVDYCYHALGKGEEEADVVKKMGMALVTTCLAFSPLLFSSLPILRQMSVFTIAGLAMIYLLVLSLLPQTCLSAKADGSEQSEEKR